MARQDIRRRTGCQRPGGAWGFVAGAILTLTLAHPTTAEQAAGGSAAGGAAAAPGIACSVTGYDLIISNRGTEPVAAKTAVDWYVPFARKRGNHVLTSALEPGGRVFLSGILSPNFMEPGAECEAEIGSAPLGTGG